MPVVVRVLGPLEVLCDGQPVAIQGGKERGLLVRLALQPGRVVPSDRLIEALWDGEPPTSVDTSLRVLVSRVRKALTSTGRDPAVVTMSPGYRLEAHDIDLAHFEALSVRGRKELGDGQFVAASTTLTQALALWRGERLAETGTRYLQGESDRLVEVRLSVLEARLAADLAAGHHADVLAELSALCRNHPLREGLWAQWITALYQSDRQADALAAYRDLRQALDDELGIAPSTALRQLEAMVLAQDPQLQPRLATSSRAASAVPAPLDHAEKVALAGRRAELQTMTAAWSAACDGRSGLALVSGEAGIGKSRLLREVARSARRAGGIVLQGRCDAELAIPFQAFVECLSQAVAACPAAVLADVGTPNLAELARLVVDLRGRCPDLPPPVKADADVERYLLFRGATSLLATLARTAPVLVVLDDLHWADRPTMQLMTYLAGMDLGRVLIVGAHRDSERPDGPLIETLGELHRDTAVTPVALAGLTPQQAVAVMAAIGQREPDDAAIRLAHHLREQTNGNPFYLTEMMRHLLETGVIIGLPDGRCTVRDGVRASLPDSIREVLGARMARLGGPVARALSMAAVIGQEFDVDLLASCTGLNEDDLLDLLEAAARTSLVQDATDKVGRFRFAHALVQQALYIGIGPARRTRAHARVAAAMEELGGREPGELAYHYLAGISSATTERAIHHCKAAGERALAVSAPMEAVRWYTAALNALPPPLNDIEHARLKLALGVAQRQADDPGYRETLLSAAHIAHRNGVSDLLVDAALAIHPGGFSSLGEVDTEKVAVLETALTVVPLSAAKRARLLAALSGELTWHPDHHRRIALADEAVAVARSTGDPDTLFDAILRPGPATWVPETSEQRVDIFREAVSLAERANDPIGRIDVVSILSSALLERGFADRFDMDLDAAAQIAMEFQEPLMRSMILLTRCCLTVVRGDLELAEEQASELLEVGGYSGDPQEGHSQVLGIIRWHQGRLVEALPVLRATLDRMPDLSNAQSGLAFALAVTGDRDLARTMLNRAGDTNFEMLYGPAWLGCMCQWAAVAAELGDTRAAEVLYSRLHPWKEMFGTTGPMPIHGVSHTLGRLAALLGDTGTADRHFELALRTHERMRAPFYTAETELYWAKMLIPTDLDRARSMLTHALELAARHGFRDIERRATQTLLDA